MNKNGTAAFDVEQFKTSYLLYKAWREDYTPCQIRQETLVKFGLVGVGVLACSLLIWAAIV